MRQPPSAEKLGPPPLMSRLDVAARLPLVGEHLFPCHSDIDFNPGALHGPIERAPDKRPRVRTLFCCVTLGKLLSLPVSKE